ncbi:SapB/AmfS family lanthipeptide [Streptomyces aureoversilis]|uniref:SapB/AmfS family lanthipeptide n=1 Tax=Streptomyces aureoversilis TaxID=67277 RepID=A0ABW0A0W6_9ACTN
MVLFDLQTLEIPRGTDDPMGFRSTGDSALSLLICPDEGEA